MKPKSLVSWVKLQQKLSVTVRAQSGSFGIVSDPTSYTHLCRPNPYQSASRGSECCLQD